MKLNGRGLIATIIYHLLLLLLLLFAGLTFPVPPPEEEGILVNFGTDETGLGDYEPSGDDQQAGDPEPPRVEESTPPLPETTAPERQVEEAPAREQTAVREQTPVELTQDVEETKVKEDPRPTPEELERQRQEELERQRQAELERQRQAELERQRQEELERQRLEELERQRQAELERQRQEQAERLNNAGRAAFGRQGVGENEGGEGVTEGAGNQGDPNGSPDADRYDTGGGLGDGISFGGLGSRRAVGNLPKPNMSGCDVTQKIEVRVEIQVDREGNVVSAIVTNATYQDNCIWTMVVDAAKRSRFSVDQNAAYRQTGWIKYIIVP
jgi:hypothetical protein